MSLMMSMKDSLARRGEYRCSSQETVDRLMIVVRMIAQRRTPKGAATIQGRSFTPGLGEMKVISFWRMNRLKSMALCRLGVMVYSHMARCDVWERRRGRRSFRSLKNNSVFI